jgi:CRP-like cAMP-binding protein
VKLNRRLRSKTLKRDASRFNQTKNSKQIGSFGENVDIIPAGTTIFREGENGNNMYVIQEGEANIIVNGQVVETIGPGGIAGELSLIEPSPRSATVTAKTECKVVSIDEAKFKILVHHTPYFALQVMRVMADRLRNMNKQLN